MSKATARGPAGSIYADKTKAGTRYRFVFRDARGRQTSRNGFLTRAAAREERERLMGKVHRGEVRVSRESLEGLPWTFRGCARLARLARIGREAAAAPMVGAAGLSV